MRTINNEALKKGTSKIEWTEDTWNPLAGCSLVSAGCKNCYAMKMAFRLEHMGQAKYAGTTEKTEGGNIRWTGKINIDEKALQKPLLAKKPTTYFVNSMSDLFHEDVPFDFIDKVWQVMLDSPHHIFQILTKRPERMVAYFNDVLAEAKRKFGDDIREIPLPNVWLGVSVEDQAAADKRIPLLLKVPAAVRFLSCEPLLGPVIFDSRWLKEWCPEHDIVSGGCSHDQHEDTSAFTKIDWVIVGGESGKTDRPMHPDWARALRDQCKDTGVPFFFKQWGAWLPWQKDGETAFYKSQNGKVVHMDKLFPNDGHILMTDNDMGDDSKNSTCLFENVGKNAAGRELDGVTHNEMPNACKA